MSTCPFLLIAGLEFLAHAIREEREIKVIQRGKEEDNLALFVDHMILYMKDPKGTHPIRKHL